MKLVRYIDKPEEYTGSQRGKWAEYECSCGSVKSLITHWVTSGNTKSCGCSRHKPRVVAEKVVYTTLYARYLGNAQIRNILFELSYEQFVNIICLSCAFCGEYSGPLKDNHVRKSKRKQELENVKYSGIDRKDNTQGYTLLNSIPCCKFCNLAKHTLTVDEFLTKCRAIVAHQKENE